MKKLVSTVAALAVVVAMGATAFAAELPSPTTTADITAEPISLDSEFYDIEVNTVDYDIPTWVIDDLKDAVADSAGDTEVAAIELTELTLINTTTGEDVTDYVDPYNPITVAFAFDDAQNVIAVFEWDLIDGGWVEADFEIVDGKVVADLDDIIAPVVFVTKAVKADDTKKDDGKGSAQTGYDSLVYVVSAVALAAGAVFFFASSKKTAKEVM